MGLHWGYFLGFLSCFRCRDKCRLRYWHRFKAANWPCETALSAQARLCICCFKRCDMAISIRWRWTLLLLRSKMLSARPKLQWVRSRLLIRPVKTPNQCSPIPLHLHLPPPPSHIPFPSASSFLITSLCFMWKWEIYHRRFYIWLIYTHLYHYSIRWGDPFWFEISFWWCHLPIRYWQIYHTVYSPILIRTCRRILSLNDADFV